MEERQMTETENRTYTLKVYNTVTKRCEDVFVSETVYRTCKRTAWNIANNNRSFYAHEIQMSGLIGGQDGSFENFREFIDEENTPEKLIQNKLMLEAVKQAVNELPKEERSLIMAIYFQGATEREYAENSGVTQQNVHKRKKRILKLLKNILE